MEGPMGFLSILELWDVGGGGGGRGGGCNV